MWEVERSRQHSRRVLAMVYHMLVVSHKGSPVIVYGASFVYIPAHQSRTSMMDTLKYLQSAKEDNVVLVSTPAKLLYSPQPRWNTYYTLLPISSYPDVNPGTIGSFATATLLTSSSEGQASDMATCIKLSPCFGSSKQPKIELIEEPVLARGPLWHNTHYIECNGSTIVCNRNG